MVIDMNTIGQYTGEESTEYDDTIYKKMDAGGAFTGGIPAASASAGPATGSVTSMSSGGVGPAEWEYGGGSTIMGGAHPSASVSETKGDGSRESDAYLRRNLDLYQYKTGKDISRDRLF